MTGPKPQSARERLLALLLEQRLAQKGAAPLARQVDTITRQSGTDPAPLTHTQRRAWFLAQLDPANAAYNEARAYRVQGPIDIAALKEALRALIARHEILRTTYATVGDEPLQFVHESPVVDFAVIDLAATLAETLAAARIADNRTFMRPPFSLAAAARNTRSPASEHRPR